MSAEVHHTRVERVYVWEVPVRLTHWLIVASILLLAVTGLYIGSPVMVERAEAFLRGEMEIDS